MTAVYINIALGSLRPLTAALSLALAGVACADTAAAQSAPTNFHVLELDYAPARATPGLDLRPGRYLLQLRATGTSSYEGLLRGPRNEIVSERLVLSGSGCSAGLPVSAAVSTRAEPAQRALNTLAVEIGDATGTCRLHGALPNLGFTAPEKPPQELECIPPEEEKSVRKADSGPTCNIVEWEPPLSAAQPDLEPGPWIQLAGTTARWTEALKLTARNAIGTRQGRCRFSYAYLARNSGAAPSGQTDSSLTLERRLGLQLDSRSLARMAPGGLQRIEGELELPPGQWRVFAHVDSRDQVKEWHSLNNAVSILVEVEGSCASSASP
jgi:hypothetical protein